MKQFVKSKFHLFFKKTSVSLARDIAVKKLTKKKKAKKTKTPF